MSYIYKFQNKITDTNYEYYIFIGSLLHDNDDSNISILNKDIEDNNYTDILKLIFTEEEFINLKTLYSKIGFIEQSIYIDDSIETIKYKILKYCDFEASYDELYLYTNDSYRFNVKDIYNYLTQDNDIILTKEKLYRFLLNLNIKDINFEKDELSIDDLYALNLDGDTFIKNIPIGHSFLLTKYDYPFIVDPFNISNNDDFDEFIIRNIDDITATSNKNILMDYNFDNNNIFTICLVRNMLTYANSIELIEENIIKIYYPFLYKKEILNLSILNENLLDFQQKTLREIGDKFSKQINNVSLFYDIFQHKTSTFDYLNKGIKNISFSINPESNINMPVDIIFKLLSASSTNPYIKYNPGKNFEKIYRLYTNSSSTDGKKIPFLSRPQIIKFTNKYGRNKGISVYIKYLDTDLPIICEFTSSGNINIFVEFDICYDIDSVTEIITNTVNPIINVVKDYLSQNGYFINNFSSLFDKNVTINNIDFEMNLLIKKLFKIDNYINCISSVFNIIEHDINNGITMRFKRVGNYNKMSAIDALLTQLINNDVKESEIIKRLVLNFQLEEPVARQHLASYVNELQIVKNTFNRQKLRIKANPGFLTTINREHRTNNLKIFISNINNIKFIDILPIYIDSIIRMSLDIDTTLIDKSFIINTCRQAHGADNEESNEIIADAEKAKAMNASYEIVGNNLVVNPINHDDDADKDDMFDLLFDDEDDDIEEGQEEESKDEDKQESKDEDKQEGKEGSLVIDDDDDLFNLGDDPVFDDDEAVEEEQIVGDDDKPVEEEQIMEDDDDLLNLGDDPEIESDVDDDDGLLNLGDDPEIESDVDDDDDLLNLGDDPEMEFDDLDDTDLREIENENLAGGTGEDGLEIDITGQSLHPNPLFKKLQEKEPTIFLSKGEGKFNAYSRTCPWNVRRQPVILTEKEKEELNPETYSDALKYRDYWYICPRYWSLKHKKSLTEEEVKSGKYGKIIPHDANNLPAGATILELKKHDEPYSKHYPGFVKTLTPNGDSIPCCFAYSEKKDKDGNTKHIITPAQIKRRQDCIKEEVEKEGEIGEPEQEAIKSKKLKKKKLKLPIIKKYVDTTDEYVKGPEKFPLEERRYGFLPIKIQKFFNINNQSCLVSSNNPILKKNTKCVLRYGVEENKDQSFIGSIAIIFSETRRNLIAHIDKKIENNQDKELNIEIQKDLMLDRDPILSIKELKEYLISHVINNLDMFIVLQNGNLVELFYNNQEDINIDNNLHIELLERSDIYHKLDKSNQANKLLLNKILNSYINFIKFIKDNDNIIDHTYLWDIISSPHEKLFKTGLNLIILELKEDDLTNNIEILCPTNHYSNNVYNKDKNSVILIKIGNYYEPIGIVEYREITKDATNLYIQYQYNIHEPTIKHLFPDLINAINNILSFYKKECLPLSSVSKNINQFKKNIKLYELMGQLNNLNARIISQILNYNSKVIGLLVLDTENNERGYIPCYPSNPIINDNDISYLMIDDIDKYSNNYANTLTFLNKISDISNKNILCLPVIKVLEDGLITGIITETNQYIPLTSPEMDTFDDGLIKIESSDIITAEKKSILSKDKDNERIIKIKEIQLEYEFFNAFRNTIRILLTKEKYRDIKEKIQKIIGENISYLKKLKFVKNILKNFTKDYIDFYEYDKNILSELTNITSCYYNNKCEKTKFCLFKKNICNLLIPKINLINNSLNEEVYFNRITDELIRYNRIKSFIFKPKTFLAFPDMKYSLKDDEIILLHNEIVSKPGYFDKLIPRLDNKYIKTYTHDNAMPNKTLPYSNNVSFNKDLCKPYELTSLTENLTEYFSSEYHELTFMKTLGACSFNIIFFILKQEDIIISLEDLKNILITNYNKYYQEYEESMLNILTDETKHKYVKDIKSNKIKIHDMIIHGEYYVTELDIFFIFNHYNIPSILYSKKKFKANKQNLIVLNNTEKNIYYFININNDNNTISLLVKDETHIIIDINNTNKQLYDKVVDLDYHLSIEEYIKDYREDKIVHVQHLEDIDLLSKTQVSNKSMNKKKPMKLKVLPVAQIKKIARNTGSVLTKEEFMARLQDNIKIVFNQDNPKTSGETKRDYDAYKGATTIQDYVNAHPSKDIDVAIKDYNYALNPEKHLRFRNKKLKENKPDEAWVLKEL